MTHYLHRNYLGGRTVAHNSSFGCPFACSFCAVVAMPNTDPVTDNQAAVGFIVGHEFVGVIEAVGEGVGVSVGAVVVAGPRGPR